MRPTLFLIPLLLALVALSMAQSTNFAAGPQYLITTSSSNLLRSIATPTLSLDAPPPPLPSLPEIGPPVADVPYVSNPPLEEKADLFPIIYGYPRVNVVEIISPTHPLELPASIADVGTTNVPGASVLDSSQTNIGEAAANWRTSRRPSLRLYSNADIENLPTAGGLP